MCECVCVYQSVGMCICRIKALDVPGAGVMGGFEQPDMVVGN